MNTRLMIRSIAIAVGLTFGLGLLFAIGLLVSSEIDISGGLGGDDQDESCRFTGTSAILTVYQAPLTDATQQKARLPGEDTYPVMQQRDQHVLIQLRDQRTAWADKRSGTLKGKCESVPFDATPLGEFPTLCTLTSLANLPIYSSSTLITMIGALPPGTYPLIGFNRDRYYVYLDINRGGWVLGSAGQLNGNCVMLPARPG